MAKELNKIVISEFEKQFSDMSGCVLIDYQRLNAEQTTDLRTTLRASGVKMSIIHNRLARLAFAKRDDIDESFPSLFRGPVAVLHGEDGPLAASKTLWNWQKKNKDLAPVKGGLLDGKVLSTDAVEDLAKIPDKETLQGQVAGSMISPAQILASCASSLVSHLASCAKSRHAELEEG